MTSHTVQVILFDLGNTLVYFKGRWPAVFTRMGLALHQGLRHEGFLLDETDFPQAFRARMTAYYQQREIDYCEHTTAHVLRTLLADYGCDNVPDTAVQNALRAMYAVSQAHWLLEDDAHAALAALRQKGYRLGIVSNAADDEDVQELVDKTALRPYFDIVLSSAAHGMRKPAPDIFHAALAYWNANPRQAAMVGDTLNADILGANQLGLFSVWLTRRADNPGNRACAEEIKPAATIGTLAELGGLMETTAKSGAK